MGINNFKAFPSPNHQDSNVWNGKDCTWGSAIPGIKTYLWPCFSPPMFCSSYLPLFQKKKKKHAKRLQCPLLFPFIPLSLSIPSHFGITFPQQSTLFLLFFFSFFVSTSPFPITIVVAPWLGNLNGVPPHLQESPLVIIKKWKRFHYGKIYKGITFLLCI